MNELEGMSAIGILPALTVTPERRVTPTTPAHYTGTFTGIPNLTIAIDVALALSPAPTVILGTFTWTAGVVVIVTTLCEGWNQEIPFQSPAAQPIANLDAMFGETSYLIETSQ